MRWKPSQIALQEWRGKSELNKDTDFYVISGISTAHEYIFPEK